MKKIAVFGNTGGGKSTLSKRLSKITNLPLYVLDKIQYQPGGTKVSYEEYKGIHEQIIATDQWIIDGFGCLETVWLRLAEADTLVYIDLPLSLHFWFVSKRFVTGFFSPPQGWPENSPLVKSSITSYRTLWLCHRRLTPKYRDYVMKMKHTKTVYHLQSMRQISEFWDLMQTENKALN
ncbi:adenylate kinase [Crocosphaera sp. XPORK-15E]|uniref:adenylate kinase n=1 Tax=Crocosphaera sp. XPORK-15E TaxID=3110247 RepID=UPI002B217861|nr:adenylate kinase [Crocosphaera sp. XPORK-15E]MEA5534614.1 adenylate kinase [Crocosphaera sp. XPORK-15E]